MQQKYIVQLTEQERIYLEKLTSSGTAPARKLTRAHILLKSDSSANGPKWNYQPICAAYNVTPLTVMTVRKSFMEKGLEATLCRKKPAREYRHGLEWGSRSALDCLSL